MIIDELHNEVNSERKDIEEKIPNNNIKESTQNASNAKVISLNEDKFIIHQKKIQQD